MKHTIFNKTKLATSLSLVLGAASLSSINVQAAEADAAADDEDVEVIQVTGIRGSMIRAMDLKRESDGVVDGISAEDIGKFPDTNLAESLQRITGVSIDRQNGEGSRVTVRGFGPDYNLVTLNGRQMPTANIEATSASSSRSFDFGNLASEGVSAVEVFKTTRAKNSTGGIGSAINIVTAKPLENPGLKASVGVKGVMDQSTEEGSSITPEISGIYSQTFADDTFGVSVVASLQERDSGYNAAETSSGWYTINGYDGDWGTLPGTYHEPDPSVINRPGLDTTYSLPRNLNYNFNEVQRTRTNAQVTLQYKPADDITATLDYTFAENDVETQRQDLSAWFNSVHISSEWTDASGMNRPVAGPVRMHEGSGTDVGLGTGEWGSTSETNSLGFNLEWDVSENLSLEFDMHSSEAENAPNDRRGNSNVISAVQFDRVSTTVDYSKDFPVMDIMLADGVAGLDPSRMMTSGSSFRNSYMKSEIDQVQASGTYTFDEGVVESIDFGIAATTVDNRTAYGNAQRDTWGGYGSVDQYPDEIFKQESVADKFDNLSGSGSADLEPYYYSSSLNDLIDAIAAIGTANGESFGECGVVLCAPNTYQVDRRTEEEMMSLYVQANMTFEVADIPVDVVAGLRYEETDVTASALVPIYDSIIWAGDNEFVAQTTGESDFTTLSGSYDNVLPSIDVKFEPMEDVIVRASYGYSIGRPGYADIQGGQTINQLLRQQGGTGSSGNPNLEPLEAANFDLSAEYYYDEASYASIGYYYKDVENFLGTSTYTDTTFDLPHPGQGPRYDEAVSATGSTDAGAIRQYFFDQGWVNADGNIEGIAGEDASAVFTFTQPDNAQSAEVEGFEIAVQHMFSDTGFGGIINYTTVESDVGYDNWNTNKGADAEPQFVITGLSDSANLVAFYDKDGIQVRVAYNWRDKFLNSTVDGGGEQNPVYTEAYGQWDINASYQVNENLSVFLEGINVTDEYQRTHGRHENMVVGVYQAAPRYNIGARYTF